MDTEKTGTIPPGIVQLLAAAKRGFWINMAILTAVLAMMIAFIFIFGSAEFFRCFLAFMLYLGIYLGLALKAYEDWQEEKASLLGKKKPLNRFSAASRPISPTPNTAPTSRIDPQDMAKLRSGATEAKEE